MMHGSGWGTGLGWTLMILSWAPVIAGMVAVARWVLQGRSEKSEPRDRAPLDVLKERYARGEIEREQFEQKRHDLER